MKTRDLLLEVGTEEIPAGFVRWALDEIVRIAEKDFKRERLSFQKIQSFGTPRRITLVVRGLGENQDDLAEEFKGPLWEQAFDVNDNPTKAAKGFARSRQVEVDELEKREVGGTEYAFAVLRRPGSPATDVLPELLQGILKQIVFPKNMYWDQSFTRFARPVRWILCLFGNETVPVSFGRVASSNSTRGHRFMGDRVIEISDVDEYQDKLFDNYVLFDPDKRREKMMAAISSLEKEVGGKAENDVDLIEENLFLVEYPVPFAGSFDESFLDIPEEVLTTTMKHHQRYFPVRDSKGRLKPCFIGVSNNRASNMSVVREGNERVLRARLADASFFRNEDLKTPLSAKVEELKTIVYQEQMGTMADKVAKVGELSTIVSCELGLTDEEKKMVDRAVYLSRADIVTHMVYEFAELRGVMGREYARCDGENERVALALYEQYLPAAAGGELPTDVIGAVLGLAERADTIAGCFCCGLQPSGSQDPYGLRRSARTINEIIWGCALDVSLEPLLTSALSAYSAEEKPDGMLDFARQRLHNQLREKGYSHDLTSLAISVTKLRPLQALRFLESFAAVQSEDWFSGLITSAVRVRNLLSKAGGGSFTVDADVLSEEPERDLFKSVRSIAPDVQKSVDECDWDGVTRLLARLEPSVTRFFDDVLVMADDEKTRNNRLAILQECNCLFKMVGDLGTLKG